MAKITLELGAGGTIDAPCFSFDRNQIWGDSNPEHLRDALDEIKRIINVDLPESIGDAADDAAGNVLNYLTGVPLWPAGPPDLPVVPPIQGAARYAIATANYVTGSAPTVQAQIEGTGDAVTVQLDYAGSWLNNNVSNGREYPNVRTNNRIPVYQDTAGNWRTPTGVHDRPLGTVEFMYWTGADGPPTREGWSVLGALADRFPIGYNSGGALGAVGATGGSVTHVHPDEGHAHGIPGATTDLFAVTTPTALAVTSIPFSTETTYTQTPSGGERDPFLVLYAIRRIL